MRAVKAVGRLRTRSARRSIETAELGRLTLLSRFVTQRLSSTFLLPLVSNLSVLYPLALVLYQEYPPYLTLTHRPANSMPREPQATERQPPPAPEHRAQRIGDLLEREYMPTSARWEKGLTRAFSTPCAMMQPERTNIEHGCSICSPSNIVGHANLAFLCQYHP